MRYPRNWTVYEPIPNYWSVEFFPRPRDKWFSVKVLENFMYPPSKEEDEAICLAGLCGGPTFFKEVEIKLNNFKGIQRQIVYKIEVAHLEVPIYQVEIKTYVPRDKDVFIFRFVHPEISEIISTDIDLNNQMLSTFRFLE